MKFDFDTPKLFGEESTPAMHFGDAAMFARGKNRVGGPVQSANRRKSPQRPEFQKLLIRDKQSSVPVTKDINTTLLCSRGVIVQY